LRAGVRRKRKLGQKTQASTAAEREIQALVEVNEGVNPQVAFIDARTPDYCKGAFFDIYIQGK